MTLAMTPILLWRRRQVLHDLRSTGWPMVLSGVLLAATFDRALARIRAR